MYHGIYSHIYAGRFIYLWIYGFICGIYSEFIDICTYMGLCICIYIHICVYMYIYMYIYICICMYIRIYTYVCIYLYIYICVYIYICIYIINIYIYIYIQYYIHIYTCTFSYTSQVATILSQKWRARSLRSASWPQRFTCDGRGASLPKDFDVIRFLLVSKKNFRFENC